MKKNFNSIFKCHLKKSFFFFFRLFKFIKTFS